MFLYNLVSKSIAGGEEMENQGWVIPTERILTGWNFYNKILRQHIVLKAVKTIMRRP